MQQLPGPTYLRKPVSIEKKSSSIRHLSLGGYLPYIQLLVLTALSVGEIDQGRVHQLPERLSDGTIGSRKRQSLATTF